MPVSPAYRPDPRFMQLGPEFADPVRPAAFPQAITRFRNQRWAGKIGLDTLTDAEWTSAFARFEPLPDNQPGPLATRYHGHQFQTYNPDIGDGRGFLYAQLRDDAGRLLDLGTKGSGTTPYSRTADGRLTLKGGVREVLATAMLEGLGVPTSKSFALIETGEDLVRGDEPSPTRSAVLTRLSHSNIRFGTFQRHAYFGRADLIAALVDHVVENYYPEVLPTEGAERAAALLQAVLTKTAHLVGRWMAAGFVHGVLNTDNMNINGESFDYGPYRFLPRNDPNFTAAYFDHSGLYAYGRQPQAVFWNLQQLAGCLVLITDQAPLIEILNGFGAAYRKGLTESMLNRLGVQSQDRDQDLMLVNAAFAALMEGGEALGWEPFFFDWFGGAASEVRAMAGPRAGLYGGEAAATFRQRLAGFSPARPDRLSAAYFANERPQALLIDEIEAIWASIAAYDDWGPFTAKLADLDEMREAMALYD
jgi:uncharacterized protein YdiU (UPF0061 family)